MNILYKDTHDFTAEQLQDLFLSVSWSSGHYPEKLAMAMQHYQSVFSAWDGDRPIGIVCAMDDGVMTAYVHYLLVRPEYQGAGVGKRLIEMIKQHYRDYLRIVLIAYNDAVPFYRSCGFTQGQNETPMFITSLWT